MHIFSAMQCRKPDILFCRPIRLTALNSRKTCWYQIQFSRHRLKNLSGPNNQESGLLLNQRLVSWTTLLIWLRKLPGADEFFGGGCGLFMGVQVHTAKLVSKTVHITGCPHSVRSVMAWSFVAQNFWELLMRQHGGAITVPHFPHGLAENSIPSSLLSEKNSNCQVVYRVHFPPVCVFFFYVQDY
jgi:hypothetical protein